MSGFSILRSDRGVLAPPVTATIYEGRVARAHAPGDALIYSTGPEHRDAEELNRIVSQLNGLKVYLGHPTAYPAATSGQSPVGYVESGRLDDDSAVARIVITDQEALDAIRSGTYELSLGYQCVLDDTRYQRDINLDHLAIVDKARCGEACSMRTDMLAPLEKNMKIGTVELEVKVTGLDELKAVVDAMSASTKEILETPVEKSEVASKADEISPACTCKNHAIPHTTGDNMSDPNKDLAAEMTALKAKLDEAHAAITKLEIEATNARKDADKAKSDLEAATAARIEAEAAAAGAAAKAKTDAEEALKVELDARVEQRVALLTEAKSYLVDTDLSKLSDRDIKVAVIKHVDGDDVPAEKSMDYVDGVYAGALKRGNRADESRSAARVAINQMRVDGAVAKSPAELEKAAKENMKRASAIAWVK